MIYMICGSWFNSPTYCYLKSPIKRLQFCRVGVVCRVGCFTNAWSRALCFGQKKFDRSARGEGLNC